MKFTIPFVGWYLVVFVDILGQSRSLSQIDSLPDEADGAQMKEFQSLLQGTAGTVFRLRQCFEEYFKRTPLSLYRSDLPGEQSTSSPLISHAFSDYVVFALSLNDGANKVPMASAYELLYSAAVTFLTMLSQGHAIRGGAEVGVGWPLCEGEVYGPALSRAHLLESNVAQYPRIVVGDELVRYIEQERVKQGSDRFTTLGREYAELCVQLTATDHDGSRFLDYLGQGFPAITGTPGQEGIKMAYHFVVKEYQEYQRKRDTKLALRYALLREYFERRLRGETWMTFEDYQQ